VLPRRKDPWPQLIPIFFSHHLFFSNTWENHASIYIKKIRKKGLEKTQYKGAKKAPPKIKKPKIKLQPNLPKSSSPSKTP
jgi:hypothetical protein